MKTYKDFIEETDLLNQNVNNDSEFKQLIINYVGNKLNPENDEVTVQMVIDVFCDEFPEPILVLAEENYLRGWEDRGNMDLLDTDDFEQAMKKGEN